MVNGTNGCARMSSRNFSAVMITFYHERSASARSPLPNCFAFALLGAVGKYPPVPLLKELPSARSADYKDAAPSGAE